MFEDDVTVPAGWYPDPMGLPQLRWWNSHAWTELTTQAVSPIPATDDVDGGIADGTPAPESAAAPAATPVTPVIPQLRSSLSLSRRSDTTAADEALSRREQRAQRERDEQYANLAANALEESLLIQSSDTIEHVRAIDVEPYPEADEDHDGDNDDDNNNNHNVTPVEPSPATAAATSTAAAEPSTLTGPIFTGSIFTIADVPRSAAPAIESSRAAQPTRAIESGQALESNLATDASRPARRESPFEPRAALGAVSGSVAQNDRPTLPITPAEAAKPVEVTTRPALAPVYTGPVWIIALMPAAHLIIGLLLLLGFGARFGITPTIVILSVLYLVDVGLALLDRQNLAALGYAHRASWAWALLTGPVYLVARALALVRVGRPGLAPLGVWVLISVLQLGSILVVPGLLITALPEVFSAQAEKSVAADASIIGTKLEVDCPASPPALIGSTFTCEGSTPSGDSSKVVVRLLRVNGWIDWHVDDWGSLGLSR